MQAMHGMRAMQRHGVRRRVAPLLLSGLLLLASSPETLAQEAPTADHAIEQRDSTSIAEASRRFRIPEDWIRAVLAAESDHDIRVVSDAGAMGLMQVMPATWDELTARLKLGDDPFEPRANILAGTAYLREMLDRYGDVSGMLAAYNAGPSRYDEYLATGRSLPAETIDYVAKLAPIMGGNALPPSEEPAPKPQDWREAPLFVLPADGAPTAAALQPVGHSAAAPAQQDALSPQAPDGLFVATSSERSLP